MVRMGDYLRREGHVAESGPKSMPKPCAEPSKTLLWLQRGLNCMARRKNFRNWPDTLSKKIGNHCTKYAHAPDTLMRRIRSKCDRIRSVLDPDMLKTSPDTLRPQLDTLSDEAGYAQVSAGYAQAILLFGTPDTLRCIFFLFLGDVCGPEAT